MENKEKINPEVNKVIDTLTKEIESLNAEELHEFFKFFYKMNHNQANMICHIADTALFTDTDVTYYPTGEALMAAMLADLARAEKFIYMEYFIIADGNSRNQVQAMIDNVEETLGKEGYHPKQIEGYQAANWVLMDYTDIIVHVFDKENRLFYDLERIWRDGKTVSLDEFK